MGNDDWLFFFFLIVLFPLLFFWICFLIGGKSFGGFAIWWFRVCNFSIGCLSLYFYPLLLFDLFTHRVRRRRFEFLSCLLDWFIGLRKLLVNPNFFFYPTQIIGSVFTLCSFFFWVLLWFRATGSVNIWEWNFVWWSLICSFISLS